MDPNKQKQAGSAVESASSPKLSSSATVAAPHFEAIRRRGRTHSSGASGKAPDGAGITSGSFSRRATPSSIPYFAAPLSAGTISNRRTERPDLSPSASSLYSPWSGDLAFSSLGFASRSTLPTRSLPLHAPPPPSVCSPRERSCRS